MRTSDAGIYALALHEGIVPAPYKDSVGVWTYGIGHTAGAGAPDPAKMTRGMPKDLDAALRAVFDTFRHDLPKYEAGVNRAVKVPITQAQFDALVSFHYNTGAIGKASLVKRLNAGDVDGAAAGFMAWKKPPEIIGRRKDEQTLFAKGVYPSGQVTIWQVDGNGRVIWKPLKRLNKPQVLALLGSRAPASQPEPAAPIIPGKRTDIPRPTRPATPAVAPSAPVAPPSPAKPATGLLARILAALVAMMKRK
jgi:lysozyme